MDPRRRWLRAPLAWFILVLFEYLVLIALFRGLWPDDAPGWTVIVVILVVVAALTAANVWLARRFGRDG